MLSRLFKPKPLLHESDIQWLLEGYAWALRNFGSDEFYNQSRLLEPSDNCFPGRADSADSMAELTFNHVRRYAGLEHWPYRLLDHNQYDGDTAPAGDIHQTMAARARGEEAPLTFFYEPLQSRKPEVMIANYAHALAAHLSHLAAEEPPCDREQWPHMMELVAIHMGFGIMFANTALPVLAGGCGSCRHPAMERQGALTELQALYALAIFCALKEIPAKQAAPYLKPHLRSLLKKAVADLGQRSESLARLRAVESRPGIRGPQAAAAWES